MPGDVYLSDYDYGAAYGYAGEMAPTGPQQTQIVGGGRHRGSGGGGAHHTSTIVWLLVILVASVMILHGLKIAGFVFTFRR